MSADGTAQAEPFSVYVHLPYCLHKCPYCDFNTYAVTSVPERRYTDALLREIAHAAGHPAWRDRPATTVFFGGGTPSLFSPASIREVLEALERAFGLEEDAEITLEANPGSIEGGALERLAGFRAAGVNRLSLGGQSFHDGHLQTLGRIHKAAATQDALQAARQAGFENLSCDLIFAIPGQTLDAWKEDLHTLIGFAPDHISAYNLTYEPGTPMTGLKKVGRIVAAEEELELAMFEAAIETLGAAGYRHYEISNYAKPGRECRHNLAYWQWRDYLGLGAGAHGFSRETHGVGARRYANARLPEAYMSAAQGAWGASEETIDSRQAVAEYLLVNLRLLDGFSTEHFRAEFAADPETAVPELADMHEAGMVEIAGGRVRLSARGLRLGDAVIARLAAY